MSYRCVTSFKYTLINTTQHTTIIYYILFIEKRQGFTCFFITDFITRELKKAVDNKFYC